MLLRLAIRYSLAWVIDGEEKSSAPELVDLTAPPFALCFVSRSDRSSKLQKEQQKRRDAARARIQRERRSKEAAARDQARVEEQIRTRKLEQRRREEEVGLSKI